MTPGPKVSVLMAAHDAKAHLRQALDSVLAQTFVDFEVVIVDDRSTDGTGEILRSYNDERLRILMLLENADHTTALNAGLRLCRGVCVARMDGDDICHPGRFAHQVTFFGRLSRNGHRGQFRLDRECRRPPDRLRASVALGRRLVLWR